MPLARFTRRALLPAALGALLAAHAPAQTQNTSQTQTPQPAPTAAPSPTPATVRLGFVVTDEKGKPVAGLRQEDFRVSEDGAPQTVTNFSAERAPLSYALVVDNSGSLRSQMPLVIEAAASLVESNRPGDEAAV
ncbi:MAG TPA: hypothetical protein VGV38_16070, partial [Pyrinomonadaceae bacterium]|nr:hypothetical protein [Pyrinomonadaceae bacterium]